MTWQDPDVIDYLNTHFEPVRIGTAEQPQLARQFAVTWTPVAFALHPRNIRLRESVGYLPPVDMLAELTLMRALHAARSGKPGEGEALLLDLCAADSQSIMLPEVLYWLGILAFFRSGKEKESLFSVWRRLKATYPDSPWARKTTLTDWPDSPYLMPPEV